MLFPFLSVALALQSVVLASPLQKRAVAYYNPANGGGSMVDSVGGGLGEPINVIVSALSSSTVLTEQGFLNYVRSFGFSQECLDIHLGAPQSANLGDGHGYVNQTVELRQDYGSAVLGTCEESLIGGNHFRVFIQNGPTADSGAYFLAVSQEENEAQGHDIVPNGYDIGRDNFVAAATTAETSFLGVTYKTTAQNVTGLLPVGSAGINHGIAIDGIVTVLTVKIVAL